MTRISLHSRPQDEDRQNALHLKDLLDTYINSKCDWLTCCKKENGFNKARKKKREHCEA